MKFDIKDGNLEIILKAIKQSKAKIAFNSMRAKAAKRCYLSDAEIENEIKKQRSQCN